MTEGARCFLRSLWTGFECPLQASNYRRLLALARPEMDSRAVALLAEFRAHWQLSLDGNLGGELRGRFKDRAKDAARKLADLLLELD